MKKSIKTALLAILAVICAFAFASCGLFGDTDKDGGDTSGNNSNNNNNGNGAEQVITTSAAWDKVIDDTYMELVKADANYKIVCLGQDNEGCKMQTNNYLNGNKLKYEFIDFTDPEYSETPWCAYFELIGENMYTYECGDDEIWTIENDTYYEEELSMGEYAFFRFIGMYHLVLIENLKGNFDNFSCANGEYSIKENKASEISPLLYDGEYLGEATDISIKIADGKISEMFYKLINDDYICDFTLTFTYGGQTVTLPTVA